MHKTSAKLNRNVVFRVSETLASRKEVSHVSFLETLFLESIHIADKAGVEREFQSDGARQVCIVLTQNSCATIKCQYSFSMVQFTQTFSQWTQAKFTWRANEIQSKSASKATLILSNDCGLPNATIKSPSAFYVFQVPKNCLQLFSTNGQFSICETKCLSNASEILK